MARARFVFRINLPAHQIADVAQRGVLRTLRQLRPFRAGQLTFEAVEQAVDRFALPFVERLAYVGFPEFRSAPVEIWTV